MLAFALNHMTVPRLVWRAVLDLAARLGCAGVEFRNDLPGPLFGSDDPATVGAVARDLGLRILALAEVKAFNDWSEGKAAEARALMAVAQAAGAEAVALIPRNDGVATGRADSARVTEQALAGLLPMLRDHGLKGMVEPLGFAACSLRYKEVLADVIGALDGAGTLFLVHDTFHHALAGFGGYWPGLTGMVHVSGVAEPLALEAMGDGDRVLVDADDLLGNVAQIRALVAGGYAGPVSFEAFSPRVHALSDPGAALRASMEFIRAGVSA